VSPNERVPVRSACRSLANRRLICFANCSPFRATVQQFPWWGSRREFTGLFLKPSICHWEEDKNSLGKRRSRLLGLFQAIQPRLPQPETSAARGGRDQGVRVTPVTPRLAWPGTAVLPYAFQLCRQPPGRAALPRGCAVRGGPAAAARGLSQPPHH